MKKALRKVRANGTTRRLVERMIARGWVKAIRSDDALELLKANPLALALAYVIALRAKWREGFNRHGLGQGEAMLGDFENYGMTMRQYRTAKDNLTKWGFATFRATSQGTIARLCDSRLFIVSDEQSDKQSGNRAATERQAPGNRATTNEEGKTGKKVQEGETLGGHALKNPGLIELMEQVREVLGQKEWKLNHSRWLNRAETEPDKLRRVIADTRDKAKEDGIDNPGAWAEAQWKRFK